MFTTVHLGAFINPASKRNSTGSTISTISNDPSSSSMLSLSAHNDNELTPEIERRSRHKSTNSANGFWTSTNSFWQNGSKKAAESVVDCSSQMRRISMPLQNAVRRQSHSAVRRLSNIMNQVENVVNQEILMNGEKPSAKQFGNGQDLNREWEIVTVRELCRRLSIEDSFEPSEMPLPEGSLKSQILDAYMIVDILPPRAEGYPWINIYSSDKHGFSLSTLYRLVTIKFLFIICRKMSEWQEEMSPILIIIRDTNDHVFGALASTTLKPNEHYYGTGDSCILFRFTGEFPHTRELRPFHWTGDNQFFINATRDFLSMGAGGGHYGLWLDADLNHGRSQRCDTFANEPLSGGQDEDFVVQLIEVFGFSMG